MLAKGKTPENTMMNPTLCQAFLEQGWNKGELFLQCLFCRGGMFVMILLFAYSSIRKWMFRLFTSAMGISFGIMLKLFYLWYGIKGIGLFLVATFPHFLFYWMAYGLLYWEVNKRNGWLERKRFSMILAFGVVIIGIWVESYVNPFLLSFFLKNFFI